MPSENKNQTDDFENKVRSKLSSFEVEPPAVAWTRIHKNISARPAGVNFNLWKGTLLQSGIFLISASLLLYFFYFRNIRRNSPPVSASKNKYELSADPKHTGPLISDSILLEKNPAAKAILFKPTLKDTSNRGVQEEEKGSIVIKGMTDVKFPAKEPAATHSDSIVKSIASDSIKTTVKRKSFYEKRLEDTTLKYRKLFK